MAIDISHYPTLRSKPSKGDIRVYFVGEEIVHDVYDGEKWIRENR